LTTAGAVPGSNDGVTPLQRQEYRVRSPDEVYLALRELFRARLTSDKTRTKIARAMHELEKQEIAESMVGPVQEQKETAAPVKPTRKAA
jgi:hypothetical protein